MKEPKRHPIVELYNLHLQCGCLLEPTSPPAQRIEDQKVWISRGPSLIPFSQLRQERLRKGEFWYFETFKRWDTFFRIRSLQIPDPKEQERVIQYFQDFFPRIMKEGFGFAAYSRVHGISWFESFDFLLDFSLNYYALRKLLEGMLRGEIPGWTLLWLREQLQGEPIQGKPDGGWEGVKYSFLLREKKTGEPHHPLDFRGRTISWDEEVEIIPHWAHIGEFRFGLSLGEWWGQIVLTLLRWLSHPQEVRARLRHCHAFYIPTPQKGQCPNLVWGIHRRRVYCSSTCRARVWAHLGKGGTYLTQNWGKNSGKNQGIQH